MMPAPIRAQAYIDGFCKPLPTKNFVTLGAFGVYQKRSASFACVSHRKKQDITVVLYVKSLLRSNEELRNFSKANYSTISATTPEPTVLPPSRIAKRRPFSQAMGLMSSTVMLTLSPGRHISTPSGSSITPVTSVVLK